MAIRPRSEPPADCIMIESASQLTTFLDCRRKWVFASIWKLPQIERGYRTFGKCLHAVAERYLLADDNGRDRATGLPVDLYPKGWQTTDEGTVNPADAALIQVLITKAIEEGILERLPGRQIEKEFWLPLLSDESGTVYATGFIDMLVNCDEVQDHKSVKAMKAPYAKSAASLAKDLQLLLYAKVAIELAKKQGAAIPKTITLRHNVFSKDREAPSVRVTKTTVTAQEVEDYFARLQVTALEMLKTKGIAKSDGVNWHDLRGPDDLQRCNDYGGCQYRDICSGQESIVDYTTRVNRVNSNKGSGEKTHMGLKELLAERQAKNASIGAATTPAAANAPPINPGPVTPSLAVAGIPGDKGPKEGAAPWANPVCPACTGSGFNTKLEACRICNSVARTANQKAGTEVALTSDDFVLLVEGGKVLWEARAERAEVIARLSKQPTNGAVPAVVAPVKATAKEAPPKDPTPTLVNTPTVAAAPAPAAPAPAAEEQAEGDDLPDSVVGSTTTRGRGRPKIGFSLLVNCAPVKGGQTGKIMYLDEVLARLGKVMVEANVAEGGKAEHYTDLDVWKRRDSFKKFAETICEDFKANTLVVALGRDPDLMALCDAIRPHATIVFMAAQI